MIALSPSHRTAASGSSKRDGGGPVRRRAAHEGGFTLVEVMICSLILTVGMLAIAGLLTVTAQMHVGARENARSTRVAQDKIDDLIKADFDDDPRVFEDPGGDLETNEGAYFEENPDGQQGITVRWQVAAGPVTDTRVLTVRVENRRAQNYGRYVELSTIIRNW